MKSKIFGGPERRLEAAVHINLFVDIVYVGFDGMAADVKLVGDLFIAATRCH